MADKKTDTLTVWDRALHGRHHAVDARTKVTAWYGELVLSGILDIESVDDPWMILDEAVKDIREELDCTIATLEAIMEDEFVAGRAPKPKRTRPISQP